MSGFDVILIVALVVAAIVAGECDIQIEADLVGITRRKH